MAVSPNVVNESNSEVVSPNPVNENNSESAGGEHDDDSKSKVSWDEAQKALETFIAFMEA